MQLVRIQIAVWKVDGVNYFGPTHPWLQRTVTKITQKTLSSSSSSLMGKHSLRNPISIVTLYPLEIFSMRTSDKYPALFVARYALALRWCIFGVQWRCLLFSPLSNFKTFDFQWQKLQFLNVKIEDVCTALFCYQKARGNFHFKPSLTWCNQTKTVDFPP